MKTKTNTKIKIILGVVLVILAMAIYNHHKDTERRLFATQNACEWVVVGSHDICR